MALALLAVLLLAAPAFAGDDWWNLDWHYRIRADVNASSFDRSDWIIEQRTDFSQALGNLSAGKRLDPNSIRVVEYTDGNPADEAVSQFDRDSPDSWSGDLMWQVSGTLLRNQNRTYYIYFDVLENGEKPAPGYADEVRVQSRNQSIQIDSSDFMLFIDRQYGYTHVSKKSYAWQSIQPPQSYDPLAHARENLSRYRGTISLIGEHSCDPGCERGSGDNLSDQVIYEGPLRAAVRSYTSSLDRLSDNTSIPFSGWRTTYVYAGKPWYRENRFMDFGEFPLNVSGVNRRMWILQGRTMSYAYDSRSGVVAEGPFPQGGQEYFDWNGTWSDAISAGGGGIADFEMGAVPSPSSLWAEQDPTGPISYFAALWRPERLVSDAETADFIYYFHDGDWRSADIPMRYWELKLPPTVELGNLSDFSLSLRVPAIVLNWEPTVKVEREVKSATNITIQRMDCKMYSEDRKLTLFEGEVGEAGMSVFDVPDGKWKITCVAYDQHGHAASDTAETQVYDVMTLVKVCGASLLLVFLLIAVLLVRMRRSQRRRGNGLDCPRCGMPLEEGTKACPVCGRKL